MYNFISKFANREEGAVTVDWVVLTAITIGLCIAALTTIGRESAQLATETVTVIDEQSAVME